MNSIPETIACLETAEQFNIPIWVAFTLGDAQHLLSGETMKVPIVLPACLRELHPACQNVEFHKIGV